MNPPVRPFLPYNNPSISSVEDLNAFNPKRISQQSNAPVAAKPAPMAPYIHFDSTPAKAARAHALNASPITPRGLLILRTLSVILRVFQLVGAMGILVCMLFTRKMDDITGWVCRVPPAIALLHCVYFIYHVSGSARVRNPQSSVGYFLFAVTVDLAVVCFYVFISILSWRQWQGTAGAAWATIFDNDESARKIFMTVFLVSCSAGGLALLSVLATLYLVRVFRRLALLPPDQNPFLDEKDTYTALPSKRWSQSTTDTTPSLPESSKAVPFLSTRRTDIDTRDDILYTNIPVPPHHKQRNSMYPATGHLYPAGGPVAYTEVKDKGKGKRVKKSWGNLKAPTAAKRMGSREVAAGDEEGDGEKPRVTSSTLRPEEDGRTWSFSFRKRSGQQDVI